MKNILTLVVGSLVLCIASAQSSVHNLNIDSILDNSRPDSTYMMLDYNELRAEIDIKKNDVILLMPGTDGCPPLTQIDFEFMTKYKIKYSCPGCASHGFQDLEGYNNTVFRYLKELYGIEWIGAVNEDVVGIENYR
jgi:hypothetical protein